VEALPDGPVFGRIFAKWMDYASSVRKEPYEPILGCGTFFSVGCAKWEFGASRVTVAIDGNSIRLQSGSVSPSMARWCRNGL